MLGHCSSVSVCAFLLRVVQVSGGVYPRYLIHCVHGNHQICKKFTYTCKVVHENNAKKLTPKSLLAKDTNQ